MATSLAAAFLQQFQQMLSQADSPDSSSDSVASKGISN